MEYTPSNPEIIRVPLDDPNKPNHINPELMTALAARGLSLGGSVMIETTFRSEPPGAPAFEWRACRFGARLFAIEPTAPPHAEKCIQDYVSGRLQRAADYQDRRDARVERYLDRAAAAKDEAAEKYSQARQMADVIPFGQPILVGHHSEKRDRAYRGRIENKFRASFEAQKKADYYAAKAHSAESNRAIFSDDPLADEKLAAKIARLEQRQAMMREANRHFRKGDRAALAAMGFDAATIEARMKPDFCGRIGFANYELTNNGANIRRLKERLERVAQVNATPATETEIGAVTITDNTEAGRVQVFFPGKPPEEIRLALKSAGFRWSPTNGCWQSYRGQRYMDAAKSIAAQASQTAVDSTPAAV